MIDFTQFLEALANPWVLTLALVIGTLGEVVKKLVRAKAGDTGWRGVFYVTLPAHPVVAGALLGLIPAIGMLTGLLAGLVCKVAYDTIVSTVRRQLGQGRARESQPPPEQRAQGLYRSKE